jgi:subtilisin family serine protease
MLRVTRMGILLWVAICFVTCLSAFADDFKYYSLGQQISVEPSDSLVTIIPEDRYSPLHAGRLEIDAPCLDGSYPPIPVTSTAWVYHLAEGWSPDSALEVLHTTEGVNIANPVLGTPDSTPVYITDEFIVRFHDGIDYFTAAYFIEQHGAEIIEWCDTMPCDEERFIVRMTGETAEDLLELANSFYENDSVEYSVPNFYNDLKLDHTPNDTYYEYQWYLDNVGQIPGTPGADIDFERALEFETSSNNVVIAILDVGFDLDHEDLDTSLVVCTYDAAGDDFSDPNNIPDPDVSIPELVDPSDRQREEWSHGTHVMGLITATMDNELGIAGVSSSQKFILIKVVDNNRTSSDAACALGMDFAALGAAFGLCHVVVTPWHKVYESDDIEAALKRAYKYHAVTFAPAGDEGGEIAFPGKSAFTITVGATNSWDMVEGFSARGPMLDFVAPGRDIWTTDRPGELGVVPYLIPCTEDGGYHCAFKGTSASCAIAAGVAAMVFARAPEAMSPIWSEEGAFGHPVDFIRYVLENTVEDMVGSDDIPGWDPKYGYGRLNAYTAVASVSGGDPDNSGVIDVDDIVYLINYIFDGGPPPEPYYLTGNANCSSDEPTVDIDDISFLIAYVFSGGPDPREPCFTN